MVDMKKAIDMAYRHFIEEENLDEYINRSEGLRGFDFINQILILSSNPGIREVHSELGWAKEGIRISNRNMRTDVIATNEGEVYTDRLSGEVIVNKNMTKSELRSALELGTAERARMVSGYRIDTAYSNLAVDIWDESRLKTKLGNGRVKINLEAMAKKAKMGIRENDNIVNFIIENTISMAWYLSGGIDKYGRITECNTGAGSEVEGKKTIITVAVAKVLWHYGIQPKNNGSKGIYSIGADNKERVYMIMETANNLANKLIEGIDGRKAVSEIESINNTNKVEGLEAVMYSTMVRELIQKGD